MKIGIYVEGRFFGSKEAQARAYANNVSTQSKRPVVVHYLAPTMGYIRLCEMDAGLRPAVAGVRS